MPEPNQEQEIPCRSQAAPEKVSSRRQMLMTLGIALECRRGHFVRSAGGWLHLWPVQAERDEKGIWRGSPSARSRSSPEGETRLATYRNPFVRPWDGDTGNVPCWVRRISTDKLQVFAINCAHLGCPVRWYPQSGLFMCPCHGGAYYSDGSRASGPPPRGLFEYDYKIEGGQLWIKAGQVPTLASQSPSQAKAPINPRGAHAPDQRPGGVV